ncbi:NTF2-like protein [Aureobasidium pullulans]|uniref:NTF2-like protein n=2 Tax=Aureobasidium pullulans TaxID=5580 RepID=A0A074XCR1_AURPU|nr:NTF2-like protein [Aureobasidium pullulans EXF-150]KAG2169765.1 hypothetical protein JADG_009504 [Aureobasidium pullulans]KEQ79822.1 NTF2-like protein [Aureobasidium pullulans EXF-150]THV71848.1 NTF2-like protein [Aureobasidium pullulans]THW20258.1 NTF2-like protein [Aureobasidium pullulans]THW71149.1 NTF2-like protein [Aureobasidium pullulans]
MAVTCSSHTFEDDKSFRRLSWSWAKAYDKKDWVLLRSICTPNVQWLYSDLNPAFEDKQLTAEEYVAEMSAQHGLGDSRITTQHLLGAVVFEETEFDGTYYITGDWQIQASHRRVLADGEIRVWNGFSYVKHYYARDADGEWKLSGIQPHDVLMQDGHPGLVLGAF